MTNKGWEKVETIFHSALKLKAEERQIYLQTECADNLELREDVESLLESFENKAEFLDKPVFEMGLGAIGEAGQKNLAGQEIGVYHIEEKIGAGGMGEVYRAVDTKLNRLVALKFLPPSMENDRAARRRLVKEAQAAAALSHQNICAVHSVEELDEQTFIVMQYIDGETLDKSLNGAEISVEEFKFLARQILTAVAFAHSHGVIHRDLKPGNIMLTEEGEIKILDFGLAKIIPTPSALNGKKNAETNFSQNGLVIGTVAYMSPEQLRGEKLDYGTDIFSVGIILYEILAKKNPFNRKSQAETIAATLSEKPAPLREFASEFPANLLNLVEKCLEKDAKNRFQSAAEILVELDNAESENYRAVGSKNRSRFFLKAALATVVLIAIFAAGFFFYNTKRPQRTLAVLPISIEQGLSEKEYLADGLTQSVIEKLSNLSDLKVKSEFFTGRYKGKAIEAQTAGRELKVEAVYFGSIVSRNGGLFLKAKLLRTSDGLVIDEEEFKIEESKLIELPQDIASHIIGKIRTDLTEEDKTKLAKKDTENAEAKKLYIQGRYYLSRRNEDDLQKAEQYFRQAVDLDSYYAKAWAGLADTYSLYSVPGHKGSMSPEKAIPLAKAAAKSALEIDDSLTEPYNSLGMIKLRYEWDWGEAESNFRDAIRRDPEFPQAHWGLSNLFMITGRLDEALEESLKAKELAPYSVSSDLNLAGVYFFKRDYEQMEKVLSEALEKFPNHPRLSYYRGLQRLETNKIAEATEIFEKIYAEDKILGAALLGFIYGKTGQKDKTLEILATLEELSKKDEKNYIPSQEKAIIYHGLGETDKVFEYLNKACKEKFSAFPYIIRDPIFDEINLDARFADLRKCANL